MTALYTLLGTLIALGVLVTFHEFGHFWVARRCGIKVLRFSVGFGSPLVRWHDKHGTEFVIAAIPLGGYVKMLDEREGPVPEALKDQAFNRKTVGQRMAVVAAGPIANFLLAIAFFWALGVLGSQQLKPVLGSVEAQTPAALAGLNRGQEIVAIDGVETRSWSEVNLRLIQRIGETGELTVSAREEGSSAVQEYRIVLSQWLRDAEGPDPMASLGFKRWYPEGAPLIAGVRERSLAERVGLQAGDRLVRINDQALRSPEQVVELTRSLAGQHITLVYERSGLHTELDVALPSHEQAKAGAGYLGAQVSSDPIPEHMFQHVSYGPIEAIGEGVKRTWNMTVLTLDSLKKMLFGELSVKNLSGPITIAKVAGASAESGVADFLNFLAILSISLGVLNLLPIPVLDGGHLMFYLIEWVRGRPLSERVQTWGVQIGISLVFGVMILAIANDIGRL